MQFKRKRKRLLRIDPDGSEEGGSVEGSGQSEFGGT